MSCRNIPCPNPRQGGCGRRWSQEALQSAMDTNVQKNAMLFDFGTYLQFVSGLKGYSVPGLKKRPWAS